MNADNYLSLSPSHLETKSEEATERNVELLASVATALARYDFPVPGGLGYKKKIQYLSEWIKSSLCLENFYCQPQFVFDITMEKFFSHFAIMSLTWLLLLYEI